MLEAPLALYLSDPNWLPSVLVEISLELCEPMKARVRPKYVAVVSPRFHDSAALRQIGEEMLSRHSSRIPIISSSLYRQ